MKAGPRAAGNHGDNMAWPHIVTLTTTCPDCSRTAAIDVVHQPFQRVHGSRDRIYRSVTWADCPACGCQWQLDACLARGALPAA